MDPYPINYVYIGKWSVDALNMKYNYIIMIPSRIIAIDEIKCGKYSIMWCHNVMVSLYRRKLAQFS